MEDGRYSVYSSGSLGGTYWDQGKVGPFYGATDFNYRYNENGSFGNYPDTPCAGNHIVAFRAGSDYTEFANGVSLGTLTVANTAAASGGSYKFWGGNNHRIGNDSSTYEPLNFRGDVAELLIYNRTLNAAERVIVENYLAAKYGEVLGANDVYTGDDLAKGDYDLDVIGIGSKTGDALAPGKISTSENVAGLQLAEMNASLDVDGEFLLAGQCRHEQLDRRHGAMEPHLVSGQDRDGGCKSNVRFQRCRPRRSGQDGLRAAVQHRQDLQFFQQTGQRLEVWRSSQLQPYRRAAQGGVLHHRSAAGRNDDYCSVTQSGTYTWKLIQTQISEIRAWDGGKEDRSPERREARASRALRSSRTPEDNRLCGYLRPLAKPLETRKV